MRKNTIKLNGPQLKKIIKESIMHEVSREKVMPSKYYEIFRNRVRNASHGSLGDVKRAVREFYLQFKDKVAIESFTYKNLMDLADKIQYGSHDQIIPGAREGWNGFFAPDELGGDNDAFGPGRFDENKKRLKLSESQLRKVIKESVKKVLNEDLFKPFRTNGGDNIISVTPVTYRDVMKDIRAGKYDYILDEIDDPENCDWEEYIDVSAQNMDTATDIFYDVKDALLDRLGM